jgi:hypothetical protein
VTPTQLSRPPATGWLKGAKGLSAKTINDYLSLAESTLIPFIGVKKLKD